MTHLVYGIELPCGDAFEVVANTERQARAYVSDEFGMMHTIECIGSIDSRHDMEGMYDARGE